MTATPETRADWPRQLRLPGQADAPEGPVDLSLVYALHHAFRRDLAAFTRAVPRTPVDEPGTWRALLRRWEVFAAVLHHHHEAEDTWLWPALLERAQVAERETLAAMEAEHAEIDPILALCLSGLRMLAAGHAHLDDRAALTVRLTAARESLGRHLAHEERDAMRVLQRCVTPDEWASIEPHLAEGPRPRQVLALVPWAVHGLTREQRRAVMATAALPQRIVWRLARRRFARLDRAAFRYAEGAR